MPFIDRSNVNGSGDNYAEGRVGHVYLKATEGEGFTDSLYRSNDAKARAQGAIPGAYHFARPDLGHTARDEAAFFLQVARRPKPGELKLALDIEKGNPSADIAFCEKFVLAIKAAVGDYPVIYGSTSFVGPMRAQSKILAACPWWRAEYGPNDGRRHPLQGGNQGAVIHQFTSVGRIPGIVGDTDVNRALHPTAMLVMHRKRSKRLPQKAWLWAQWYMGIGRYKGRARVRSIRPRVPQRIPKAWWRLIGYYQRILNR